MAALEYVLSDGVKRIAYNAAARTSTVYYATGAIDYFYGVQLGDVAAVAASPEPLQAVTANFSKYTKSSGHR